MNCLCKAVEKTYIVLEVLLQEVVACLWIKSADNLSPAYQHPKGVSI